MGSKDGRTREIRLATRSAILLVVSATGNSRQVGRLRESYSCETWRSTSQKDRVGHTTKGERVKRRYACVSVWHDLRICEGHEGAHQEDAHRKNEGLRVFLCTYQTCLCGCCPGLE